MKPIEDFNFNSKLYQGKKQYNNSVLKGRYQPSRLGKDNEIIERKSKIVQKSVLETEVIKIGNKKYIFLGNTNDKSLDMYTEVIKQ